MKKSDAVRTVTHDPRQLDIEDMTRAPRSRDNKLSPSRRELPDPTPIAPPIGFVRQPSLTEQIRSMVRSEQLRHAADAAGAESFEEADDFDVGDDFDPRSPYENEFDPPLSEMLQAGHDAIQARSTPPPQPPAEGGAPGGAPKTPPEPPPVTKPQKDSTIP